MSGTYTKLTWANNTDPALNATNLQHLEDKVKDIDQPAGSRTDGDLDADTVSGYGIGVDSGTTMVMTADNYKYGGIYYCSAALTNAPFSGAYNSVILVMPGYGGSCVQLACLSGSTISRTQRRAFNGTSWGNWYEIWDAYSDDNGGQQPAPKPSRFNATTTQGRWAESTIACDGAKDLYANMTDTAGSSSEYYAYVYFQFSATGAFVAFGADIWPANTLIKINMTNTDVIKAMCWRVAG